MKCNICPRNCNADRDNGETGFCGVTNEIRIARIAPHMWEEPCISGTEGSGTVFFIGCSMGCIYCQNYEISSGLRRRSGNLDLTDIEHVKIGKSYTVDELADAFLQLEKDGLNNINLVTPTHYSCQVAEAIRISRRRGLGIPLVYNCSGYEKTETLRMLEGLIDIYLTDFKYMDKALAEEYSRASDYVDVAKEALHEMVRQQPECVFDERGIMKKGVIVRNLLLPGNVSNSKKVVEHVYNAYGDRVYISIMNQYTPLSQVKDVSPINRKVTKREYKRLLDYTMVLGVTNAYFQEGDVAEEGFIPEFS